MRFDTMKNTLLWFVYVVLLSAGIVRTEFYSDISDDDYNTKLHEIASYLRKQMEALGLGKNGLGNVPSGQESSTNVRGIHPLDYAMKNLGPENEDTSVFGVGPSDPRYFHGFGNRFTVSNGKNRGGNEPDERNFRDSTSERFHKSDGEQHSTNPDVRQVFLSNDAEEVNKADIYFTAIVAGCSAAAVASIIVIGISCYRLHKNAKAAANVDYPAYGVTGPNKDFLPTSGDRKLAQSAQMYHYQHQKQQIIAMESMNDKGRRGSISDAESEDDNEEGDYTVYECPGLAPTGEMEVKNPLFHEDSTVTDQTKSHPEGEKPNDESQDVPNPTSLSYQRDVSPRKRLAHPF